MDTKTLIAKATLRTKSHAELARQLGVPASHIPMMLSGAKPPSASQLAAMAIIADVNDTALLRQKALEKANPKTRAILLRAWGKADAGLVQLLGFCGASAAVLLAVSGDRISRLATMYTRCGRKAKQRRRVATIQQL